MSEEDITGVFTFFDKNNSGTITGADAGNALRTLGKAPSEEQLKELVGGKSKIDLSTFRDMVQKADDPTFDEVSEAFATFDTNSNGYIQLKELINLMKNLGEGLPQDVLDKLSVLAEPDADQLVNYRRLVDIIMKDL